MVRALPQEADAGELGLLLHRGPTFAPKWKQIIDVGHTGKGVGPFVFSENSIFFQPP